MAIHSIYYVLISLSWLFSSSVAQAQERVTFLYPSAAASWTVPMLAKEAKYFEQEGLAFELVRVGGSTRIIAALIGGSAQLVHAGQTATLPAVVRGSDTVMITAISNVSDAKLIARPEIKEIKDLKGKAVGITTFGAGSDAVLRSALEKGGLDVRDVSIMQTGGQPEGLAAMLSGRIYAQRMTFPYHLKAIHLGLHELLDFSTLSGAEDNSGCVITTRSFIAQHRNVVMKFMRAFVRGMHRYKTDKEFTKKVIGKFGQINDDKMLEATWQEYAKNLQRVPRVSLKAVQSLIDNDVGARKSGLKPEKIVDLTLVEELERSGFIDALYK
jgi:NitT/TauT family transport system substrate-binding protein